MIIITRNKNDYTIVIFKKEQIKYYIGTISENIQPNYIEYALKDAPTFTGAISHYRKPETVIGNQSVTFGYNNIASAAYSYAIGENTSALGKGAHAEGGNTSASNDYSHAEGAIGNLSYNGRVYYIDFNIDGDYGATGLVSHSEGLSTLASGSFSHAEGRASISSGQTSHSEGYNTISSGNESHSEGNMTRAIRAYSHAEGAYTRAIGEGAHSEGVCCDTIVYDNSTKEYKIGIYNDSNNKYGAKSLAAHTEGMNTLVTKPCGHAEGRGTTANGSESHSEGYYTITEGDDSHAEGRYTKAYGIGSHTEGGYTNCTQKASYAHHEGLVGDIGTDSNGNYYITSYNKQGNYGCNEIAAHAEGINVYSSGVGSHSEGVGTKAFAWGSHSEGDNTQAIGIKSHAEGSSTHAMAEAAHAEGESTEASANGSHAEGYNTRASKAYAHAEGFSTSASGSASHSEGWYTTAKGDYSHASGYSTIADNTASVAIGTYNKNLSTIPTYGDAFVIGNGTSSSRSNGFRVTYDGNVYAKNNFNSSGADYAEFFEWYDGNLKKEDRVGYFVVLEGAKIKIANSNSEDILGIVSANPSIIGNSDEEWVGRYLRDAFGRYITIEQTIDYPYIDDNGKEQIKLIRAQVPLQNSNYDSQIQYQHRKDRPEWDAIGLIGILPVYDDGSCLPNKYCQITDEGIATLLKDKTKPNYRVLERISSNVIKIMFR